MGTAVKGVALVATEQEAITTLCKLQADGVSFVLASDEKGWTWYVPNLDVTPEQDDWIFHALRHGTGSTIVQAVTGLLTALQRLGRR